MIANNDSLEKSWDHTLIAPAWPFYHAVVSWQAIYSEYSQALRDLIYQMMHQIG